MFDFMISIPPWVFGLLAFFVWFGLALWITPRLFQFTDDDE